MTDILEEILAFTEGYKRDAIVDDDEDSLPCDPTTSTLPVPQPPMVPASLPAHAHQYFPPQFAPSPRGVQDDLSAFGLIHRNTPHAYNKNPLVVAYNPDQADQAQPDHDPSPAPTQQHQHQDSAAAAAAAVHAAISTCMSRPSHAAPDAVYSTRQPGVTTCTQSADMSSDGAASLDNNGHRPNDLTYMAPPSGDGGDMSMWATGNKRSYNRALEAECDNTRRRGEDAKGGGSGGDVEGMPAKKARTQTVSVVMPPSAKSILERRERAIREGRRKDAKLSESERRILRRLRNRESAERCRLRRVQQAAQLEQRIANMQVENKRLVAAADEYEKTIERLQKVIREFTAQQQRQAGCKGL